MEKYKHVPTPGFRLSKTNYLPEYNMKDFILKAAVDFNF